MSPRSATRRGVRRALATLLPAGCASCGAALPWAAWAGACADCWGRFRRAPAAIPTIDGCDAVRALWIYDAHARGFLLRAKLGPDRRVMAALGAQLAAAVPSLLDPEPIDAVVPLPSHPWQSLRRSFVPAGVLAAPVARRLGTPVRACLSRRIRSPLALKRGSRAGRARAARSMLRPLASTAPARVLLVDDVTTTGASLAAAADRLRRAGTTRIVAAVWAVAL